MTFNQLLSPDESIVYQSPHLIEFLGEKYSFYITTRRLIWYKRDGLIFKKDNFMSIIINNITDIKFKEEGIIRKIAIISVEMENKTREFSGKLKDMRGLYNELQSLQKK